MADPFKLDEGLWLQDRELVLPWLLPRRELMKLGQPTINTDQAHAFLSWEGRGLNLDGAFLTHLSDGGRHGGPAWYYADRLAYANFWWSAQPQDPRATYSALVSHLVLALGPGRPYVDGGGYPLTEWVLSNCDVTVFIGERMMEYCQINIVHSSYRPTTGRHAR